MSVYSSQVQSLLDHHLASGLYGSADELLLTALRVLQERDERLANLRREIQVGRDQLDRGEFTEYDETSLRSLFDTIESEGRARYDAARQTS